MNKNAIIIVAIILAIIAGIFIFRSTQSSPVLDDGHTDHSHADGHTDHEHAIDSPTAVVMPGAIPAGSRVIIKNPTLQPGKQTLSFELYGIDGHAWGDADLNVAHEKKMHFIVASNDFSDYQHLHPEFTGGAWIVPVNFKNNTGYQAYVDIAPTEEAPQILRVPLTIGSASSGPKVSQPESSLVINGITAMLQTSGALVSGHDNAITFVLQKSGAVVVPENYLGAKGHVVALGDNPDTFIHGHPDDHGDSEVHFSFNFPAPGSYTLFAQFQVDGVVRTFPFTVNVSDGHNEPGGHVNGAETPAATHHQ